MSWSKSPRPHSACASASSMPTSGARRANAPTPEAFAPFAENVSSAIVAQLQALERIQQRVLWLATRMIHEANHLRPSAHHTKVGGHPARSASCLSLLTALYLCASPRARHPV